ncbi:hypothetical protein NB640_12800 [Oxalobacter vibrioformis]|uniref:Uncharacterized protein n=1 Tax=Oxalobacter vibrioformis TaxID=933080 RepID=A0A9E9LYW9_9BURK|nr:hypothetical protein [Oxalobacter vibrioformis]NLC24594.1 hypothetical protein [Oxalobacter sp.]WAW09746.1 hypothetical protein NB640_11035 [Oxalobacter vibrioformis]WAW10074.1 hypothetical protein NB640_12800 [Oxalobacter vibrioformis]
MKLEDFSIGTEFMTSTGQTWRCTDVGSRTILAIEIDPDRDPSWYVGPPYIVEEQPFDEKAIRDCHQNVDDAIRESYETHKKSHHPGFSTEVMDVFSRHYGQPRRLDYPNRRLLRLNKVTMDGAVIMAYSVEKEGEQWIMLTYNIFTREFSKMRESDFVRLRTAAESDLVAAKQKGSIIL